MSSAYKNQDPLTLAKQAEEDLNSPSSKTGTRQNPSDSTIDSGIDTAATNKSPPGAATATYGSAASGAGGNREIPASEGGGEDPTTGRALKARDFEGEGGPEDKVAREADDAGGDDDVGGVNVKRSY